MSGATLSPPASARTRRPTSATVLAALLVATTVLPVLAPAAAAGSPSPDDVDILLLSDGFEQGSLGSNWTASDSDPVNGTDFWAASDARAASGSASAWAAGWGNRTSNATSTLLTDGFEGNVSANWSAEDLFNVSGYDYWGPSTARAHGGTTSLWSAAIGYNDDPANGGDTNANLSLYDNDMEAVAWRDAPSSPGQRIVMSYWYWLDSEVDYDYFFVVFNVSGTVIVSGSQTGSPGPSSGWLQTAALLPAGTSQFGFYFRSDFSNVQEGAYVDDITFTAFDYSDVFAEDFEGALAPNWTASDRDSTSGNDYWNISTARAAGGSGSAWCAQEGQNSVGGASNAQVRMYDNDMDAILWRPVDLSNFTSAFMEFQFWLDSESYYDFLYVAYFSGGAWTLVGGLDGSPGLITGWLPGQAAIPPTATRVGFVFQSDSSLVQEGAYIDNVTLIGVPRVDTNRALGLYDGGMNATMVAPISMGLLPSARLDYSYWLDTSSTSDTLAVVYMADGTWNEADVHTGSSGGWTTSSVSLPANTTQVGFRFTSVLPGTAEGAYVDDVRAVGLAPELNCTAGATTQTGVEGQPGFLFNGVLSGGVPPRTVLWDFGDGSTSDQLSPAHVYAQAGTYNVTLSVGDTVGQQCTAPTIVVVVSHDVTSIPVVASSTDVTEGGAVQLAATDAAGHALNFDWTLDEPACGALSVTTGPSTNFTAAQDAGGMTCGIQAAFGGGSGAASIQVGHDLSTITVSPASADLVEGESVDFSAVDAMGHALPFDWSAGCGDLLLPNGTNRTTFTAPSTGAGSCDVTATFGGQSGTAAVNISHDLGSAVINADSTAVVEGSDATLSFVDGAGHVIEADWSVAPASCGQFAQIVPGEVVLAIDAGAGGGSCVVEGRVGPYSAQTTLTVLHDMQGAAVSPGDLLLVEGGRRDFTFSDGRGHAVDVTWSLDPAACGSLSTTGGAATTVTLADGAGGSTCVLRASIGGFDWTSQITVEHGEGATLTISPAAVSVDEGGSLSLDATLKDEAGHTLDPSSIGWTSDCGTPSSNFGASTTVPVAEDMGGTQCNVTAAYGSLTANATVTVEHLGPFTVTVSPVNGSMETRSNASFTATVRDAKGHEITADALLAWAATCGNLQSVDDVSITYTAPSTAGACTLTVSAIVGSQTATAGTATVTVTAPEGPGPTEEGGGLDMVVVGLVAAVIVVGALGGLLWMRKRGGGGKGEETEAAPPDAK